MIRIKSLFICIFVACLAKPVMAKDFGKHSHSFPIKEEGFVTMITRKLQSVDLDKENKKIELIARERVENPTPVKWILPATKTREFFHDPTYVLLKDIVLPCGQVLHKAGSSVNPLDHFDLERRLFFVDARVMEQLEWLREKLQELSTDDFRDKENEDERDKIILVGGSVFKAQEYLGKTVYFDQNGELTSKFGIKASPAVVEQEGKMLKIIEFHLEGDESEN